MKRIVNPVQVQSSCVKIFSQNNEGSGFFVNENMILTAYHVIIDSIGNVSNISCSLSNEKFNCSIIAFDKEMDVCLLLSEKRNEFFLPLLSTITKVNESCELYGFPYKSYMNYLSFSGNIGQVLIDDISDFLICNINMDKGYDYEGLSGGPVIINGKVTGMIRRQIDEKISAISINKLKIFLETNEITIENEVLIQEVPVEYRQTVETSTPNFIVFEKINKALLGSENWYLIKGSPGSGKSTIVASFIPEDDHFVIFGRYFIKIPNQTQPIALRSSFTYFLETIENLISRTITGYPIPKEELTYDQRILRISQLFDELNSYYKKKNQSGILMIDGLDEIEKLDDFLNVLPINIPENIKIILSCTSFEILPSFLKNVIQDDQIISVNPIDISQCEAFIIKEIGRGLLPVEIVQEVAIRSEGHPLYLRYLVNFIKTQKSFIKIKDLDTWVSEIPTIDGDIKNYYNSIWEKIYSIPDKLWIVVILSQIRQPIPKNVLYEILPDTFKLSFSSYFQSIEFLLNGDERIEIYHSSFKSFVISKVPENVILANDFICIYLEKTRDSEFAINNLIFHYSNSKRPEVAIEFCNQNWADNCAIKDVAPDLVLSDIKRIINLAIDLNKTTEVIRLLLMLQRIEFRYDSVFAENTNLIAQFLISIGRFDAAIKYIVRDNTLLINNNDAILFLQLFYENEAKKESILLLNAISSRYRKVIDEGLSSKEGFSIEIFSFQLNALTLSMNLDFKGGLSKAINLLRKLKDIQDAAEEDGNSTEFEGIYRIREYASSWQMAYVLRRFDFFVDAETISQQSNIKLDDKWALMRASSAVLFNDLNDYNTPFYGKGEKYYLLIKDIEYLIKNYGFNEDKYELPILIHALIENSKDYTLVSSLIDKYFLIENDYQIRKPNGVDLDYQNIHGIYFDFICRGYINTDNLFPTTYKGYLRHKNWEEYSISLLKNIAFIEGKLLRIKFEDNVPEREFLKNKLNEIILKIDFSFDERSVWDRSYHIPENFFPIIYSKLFNILLEFNLNIIDQIVKTIKNRVQIQLGLYSEGFRNCLYEVCKILIKFNHEPETISELIEIWENHIISGVQNRWERTPELLKIAEMHGLIGNELKANETFVEILKTSMGPSWYKEDQLALINSILALHVSDDSLNKYLLEYAGLLDYASGEMTFQRYVRYEKESFVGSLINNNKLRIALEYFKTEVLPVPGILIENAELNTFDAPRIGDGYSLGARNITEQSAVLELLDNSPFMSIHLKLALCELFILNDDTFRYIPGFAKHQAQALNLIEIQEPLSLDSKLQRISEISADKEMKENIGEYLNNLGYILTESNRLKLQAHLIKRGINWNLENKTKNEDSPRQKEQQNNFDVFNKLYSSKKKNKSALIQNGLEAFKNEKISVWQSNWSASSKSAADNIKSLFTSDVQIIKNLKEHINTYNNETWIIANKLIWFLENNLSNPQILEIHKIITEHFNLLICPVENSFKKYEWMREANTSKSQNEEIFSFIIWLLNHPIFIDNNKVSDIIINLFSYEPEIILTHLFVEVTSNKPLPSTVKSATILREISNHWQQEIVDYLLKNKYLIIELKKIDHFSIKKMIYDLSINLKKAGYTLLNETVNELIPKSIILGGEVFIDEPYLRPIMFQINELNEMLILNREFCETLISRISEFCLPLNIESFQKSDKYLKRSFYEVPNFEGRFYHILQYALNVAITSRVDKRNMDAVYELLNQ